MTLLDILGNLLVVIAVVLPILYFIGFTRYGKAYKVFTLYLVFIAIIQVTASIYVSKNIDNTFLFHYYFIGQFLFLSILYFLLLKYRWILVVTAAVLIGLCGYYIVNPEIINEYHTYGVSVTQSIIIIYALLYYYKSLSGSAQMLLINTGVLLYLMVSIVFFASNSLLIALDLPKETQKYIGLFNEFSYFIFLVLIFIEWFKNYRPRKNHS